MDGDTITVTLRRADAVQLYEWAQANQERHWLRLDTWRRGDPDGHAQRERIYADAVRLTQQLANALYHTQPPAPAGGA